VTVGADAGFGPGTAGTPNSMSLAYKGLGVLPSWAIAAIIVFAVLWMLVSVFRRNRS